MMALGLAFATALSFLVLFILLAMALDFLDHCRRDYWDVYERYKYAESCKPREKR